MSTGNVSLDLLLSRIRGESENEQGQAVEAIKKRYPSLKDKEAAEIFSMISAASEATLQEKASLVVTAPPSFSLKALSTKNTVESMVKNAGKSILITGYSLSGYFSDAVDQIIEKSQRGIFVKFFVNDIEGQKHFDKLCRYQGRFLKIYNYAKRPDSMAALHAKVISVDQEKTLITSANLSYHGQEGNIELGTLVESQDFARQVDGIFTNLIFTKIFEEYTQ